MPLVEVTTANGPMDRVTIEFLNDDRIKYTVAAQYTNDERNDFFTNRWMVTLPLFMAVKQTYPKLTGSCQLWLDDMPNGPGLVFCGNKPEHVCIPDPAFLAQVGYVPLRGEFAKHHKPWHQRQPIVFWRGTPSGFPREPWTSIPRVELCFKTLTLSDFNVKLSDNFFIPETWLTEQLTPILRPMVSPTAFLDYKYSIDIDGGTASWAGLFIKLLAQNVVLKVDSAKGWRQWYYDRLVPWHNYVPVANNLDDLVQIVEYLITHDEKAHQIAANGRKLADELVYDQVLIDILPIIHDHAA